MKALKSRYLKLFAILIVVLTTRVCGETYDHHKVSCEFTVNMRGFHQDFPRMNPNEPLIIAKGSISQEILEDKTVIQLSVSEVIDNSPAEWPFPALTPFTCIIELTDHDSNKASIEIKNGQSPDPYGLPRQYGIALEIMEMAFFDVLDETIICFSEKGIAIEFTRFDDESEIKALNTNIASIKGQSKHKRFSLIPVFKDGYFDREILSSVNLVGRNLASFTIHRESATNRVVSSVKFSGLFVDTDNCSQMFTGMFAADSATMRKYFQSYELMELEITNWSDVRRLGGHTR